MPKSAVTSLVLTQPPPLTEQPAAVYLAGLAPGSRPTMRQALDALARLLTDGKADSLTLDWAALRYKHTAALRAALMEKYAPATANKALCALRRVLREALRLELIDAADYARAVDISCVKSVKGLRGRALSLEEIAALMDVCVKDYRPIGFRDAALVAILRGSGLRRQEVVNLNLGDFDRSTGAMQVLNGKGGFDRIVYLPDGALPVVQDWLSVRDNAPGALLCHVNKAGRVVVRHINKTGQLVVRRLTAQAVLFILQKRALEAGVSPFSPHDFRRTFASDLLDAGTDISTVQKLMGHADPATTVRYDRRGEEVKRRAVQALHIPGVRK